MDFPDNMPAIGMALQSFLALHAAELPEDTRTLLMEAAGQPSPVVTMVTVGEILYARRDEMPKEGKELAAQIISFATMNGWHGLTNDSRGSKMVAAIRRELKHKHPTGSWPAKEDDPEPGKAYARQPDPAEMPPLPPPPAPGG